MIEIIKDKNTWKEQVDMVPNSDFYHTYDYHQLSKNDGEDPVLIHYVDGSTSLLIPLLFRNIEDTDYKDATSVYGYAGPLVQNIGESFNFEDFRNEFNAFLHDHKIVSIFSRLHPFIPNQEIILSGLGEVSTLGRVVYIDLKDPLEIQRAKYNRRLKTYINKCRRTCTVIEGDLDQHLDDFIRLYHQNMRRVGAGDNYFFTNEYYRKVLTSSDYKSELSICIHNETQEVIAASMFMKKGNIVQYHLSGLSEDHFELNPIKLILDEMRIKSTNEGYEIFNLGGGLGSNEDSLFRFKSGFSKTFEEFKTWKYIVNEQVYRELSLNRLGDDYNLNEVSFFPAYRFQNKVEKV
ncbi:peptidoglycan bridge formation glycyltransferase FemA/FemB family protein [Winogradskyella tangerina]|uniref:peptidoglycan bridge formation glycyltransferase FemA/FemB family protein n=1 Tax=Winogradskyella tangerina TaxID=2023240 RepID=UPI000DBE9B06|nr:peptidoglycan bridge formation glycyltransferase FemA/FemB family protein [Winogradskyella tangerina]